MRIRDIVNSHVRVRASLQLDPSRAREFSSDMAKLRMRTREFAQLKRMRLREIVNSRVRACAS
mgnify:CR=1 FL=1